MTKSRFWQFVHNCVAHPLEGVIGLFLDPAPEWVDRFHNWTADRAYEDGPDDDDGPFGESARDAVYYAIDGERDYQDAMNKGPDGRTDGRTKQVGAFLSLMQHALNEAHASHYEKQGDTPALHFVRKLTALGVQCMEIHGAPPRVVTQ